MDIRDTSAVINALNDAARGAGGGSPETWRVETFDMVRESPAHGHQEVTVTILDRGDEISPRYFVSAETKDGRHSCSGNSGDDLSVVIATVHWYQLDR